MSGWSSFSFQLVRTAAGASPTTRSSRFAIACSARAATLPPSPRFDRLRVGPDLASKTWATCPTGDRPRDSGASGGWADRGSSPRRGPGTRRHASPPGRAPTPLGRSPRAGCAGRRRRPRLACTAPEPPRGWRAPGTRRPRLPTGRKTLRDRVVRPHAYESDPAGPRGRRIVRAASWRGLLRLAARRKRRTRRSP